MFSELHPLFIYLFFKSNLLPFLGPDVQSSWISLNFYRWGFDLMLSQPFYGQFPTAAVDRPTHLPGLEHPWKQKHKEHPLSLLLSEDWEQCVIEVRKQVQHPEIDARRCYGFTLLFWHNKIFVYCTQCSKRQVQLCTYRQDETISCRCSIVLCRKPRLWRNSFLSLVQFERIWLVAQCSVQYKNDCSCCGSNPCRSVPHSFRNSGGKRG